MSYKILVINPGSTSTKISVYQNEEEVFTNTLRHSAEELEPFKSLVEQFSFRKAIIISQLDKEGIATNDFDAIIGRGGILRPLSSGTYEVNERMKNDLTQAVRGEHASNLGGLIASDMIASCPNAQAFIADPVVVDEMIDVARLTGIPEIKRRSIFHALNQKAMARLYAKDIGMNYQDLNLIVAHMGGGISVGAHKGGKVIDVNNAVDGDGPFSPERAGTIPAGDLLELSLSGKYSKHQIKKMLNGVGGLMAHLGLNAAHVASAKAEAGDKQAELVLESMAYNIAKNILAMSAPLLGKVDAVILTGGIAYNDYVCSRIKKYIGSLVKVVVYPGEDEMRALALNCLAVLKGEDKALEY